MTVTWDQGSGSISIGSASSEVVHVPRYSETLCTRPAPATPVHVTDEHDWSDFLMTGAVGWGSAIILEDIFDDADWGSDWAYGYSGGGNDISRDGDKAASLRGKKGLNGNRRHG